MKTAITLFLLLSLGGSAVAQQRIITAGGAASEIVCALGHCAHIVATDRTSTFPEHLQGLPSIGYRSGISAEGIIAQRPDLIIFEREYPTPELATQLASSGIQTLAIPGDKTLAAAKERIQLVAKQLGKKAEGDALVTRIDTQLSELTQKLGKSPQPTVLCVYARGAGNLQVGGKNSAFDLLKLAGAKNAAEQIEGYKPLNAEALLVANPDFILFFTSGLESLGGIEAALNITGVAQTTAGKKKQIISMDGGKLTSWGPRIAEAAWELFQLTHPEEKQ